MTAFTTPSSKSRPSGLLRGLALGLLLLASALAGAAEIEVRRAELSAGEESWLLDAEFGIDLGQRLEEVVARGVALYFVAEFELTKGRWYWVDEHVAGRKQTWRLSYNALTRQYRLSSGALHQSFASLDEALRVLGRLREWPVAEKALLKAGEPYNAALRLKLDLTQLPKPFQVTAIGNKDWNITAEVKRWSFSPPPATATEGPAK
ncbi:MAG: DUF4390 domain-containing protein [Rhodocyclaceae bacterium]|jgi:hypothetical protein|nr:DUF4390 domain-containing protein [Rhodocyclaceae bacterium]